MTTTLNQSQQMLIDAQQALITNANELAESNRVAQQDFLRVPEPLLKEIKKFKIHLEQLPKK